ncbi:carbohydrate-binding family 9-like protein [bacterium]|nr:carbohydrate-binding family 9-like protein [bacterium]
MKNSISLAAFVTLVLLGCQPSNRSAPDQPRAPVDGSPPLVGGRLEPTIAAGPNWTTAAERLALIGKAQAKRLELLQKLPPPVTLCRRVPDHSITIDGDLNDPPWQSIPAVGPFRATRSLREETFPTAVKMAWDSQYLYFAFDCPDPDLVATIKVPDGEFWRDDAVEVFINANGDEMSYLEFETSPLGLIYDACLADYRPEITWIGSPEEMTHLDIEKSIRLYKMHRTLVRTAVTGTLNDPADVDQGWTCEIAMSWDDLRRGLGPAPGMPPADGVVWRIGLYRVDVNTDQARNPGGYYAWNPTTGWFHAPWLFGRVIFVGE